MNSIFPSSDDVSILLDWFSVHGKIYPWSVPASGKPDPYAVWVSEVMLQQTTVSAVLPRYQRWMDRFPGIDSLAQAARDDVLREWEGLGYYARAKNLHSAAQEACERYGSRLPNDVRELKELPGVGEYIASAVASFAYGEKTAVIEANGRRIIQRLTASENWSRKLEKQFKTAAEKHMPDRDPGAFNASLMQFGQQVCLPRKPKCEQCPLIQRCESAALGLQDKIPVRRRVKIIRKTTDLALIVQGEKVWVRKPSSGIAAGLWGFPSVPELSRPEDWVLVSHLDNQLHSYTRYRDELKPGVYRRKSHAENLEEVPPTSEGLWKEVAALDDLGMPTAHRAIARSLSDFKASRRFLMIFS